MTKKGNREAEDDEDLECEMGAGRGGRMRKERNDKNTTKRRNRGTPVRGRRKRRK